MSDRNINYSSNDPDSAGEEQEKTNQKQGDFAQILYLAKDGIKQADSLLKLQNLKVELLGKSSLLNQEMQKLSKTEAGSRKILGQQLNEIKQQILAALHLQEKLLTEQELARQFASEYIDLTIPSRPEYNGSIHPITQCLEELGQIFASYGFVIKNGPDIEDEWYNFTALNIAENHPSRQLHDTFYLKKTDESEGIRADFKAKLLRTHTSPVQIRTMEKEQPPFCFIAPGRTYRSDSDSTHTPMFHQIEGLVIDSHIHIGHLKYVIINVIRSFFEQPDIEIRFRPHFFPFTEPSAEVDVKMPHNNKWLEVLGCGMVHPNVLKNSGVNNNKYQGFAFGLGVERMAMLKYNIPDLREFYEGDIRWLNHYNFAALDIPSLFWGLTR